MPLFTPAPVPADRSLLQAAALVSIALHLLLLLLPGKLIPQFEPPAWTPHALQILLVPAATPAVAQPAPRKIAEHDSAAGKAPASTSKNTPVATAATGVTDSKPQQMAEATPPATYKNQTTHQAQSDYRLREPENKPGETPSQDWLAQARQLAAKTALGENDSQAKGIYGVSATGVSWARYVEDWRLKIERLGKLNYPAEARSRNLTGTLELAVVIRADGSLQDVRLLRSSGHDILDKAARDIVELSAPYPPFPPKLSGEFRSLEIVRRWHFTNQNQFQ